MLRELSGLSLKLIISIPFLIIILYITFIYNNQSIGAKIDKNIGFEINKNINNFINISKNKIINIKDGIDENIDGPKNREQERVNKYKEIN